MSNTPSPWPAGMLSYTHTKSEYHFPSIPSVNSRIVYVLRGNTEPKYQFAPGAQVCGLVRVGKNLVIGLANKSLVCYTPRVSVCHVCIVDLVVLHLTTQGKHLWSVGLPDLIATMVIMDHQSKMTQAGGSGRKYSFELCDIQCLFHQFWCP